MKWQGCDLCYCQNIHPGTSWAENFAAIKTYIPEIRSRICPEASFGIGLRLSAVAAAQLKPALAGLKEFLKQNNFYVFTINGFPYGAFHNTPVKQAVYLPDWSSTDRLDYTLALVDILSELLPADCYGSISTVPVCYGKTISTAALDNLLRAARYCKRHHERSGKKIVLGLEPEPDCFFEATQDTIDFFEQFLSDRSWLRDYIGVCLDTCHAAVQLEEPLLSLELFVQHEIAIPKVQLTAALVYEYSGMGHNVLRRFEEPVYLHQTRVQTPACTKKYHDLTAALDDNPAGTWYVHYHVPLHFKESPNEHIKTTAHGLNSDFFSFTSRQGCHLEIETYTFSVLAPDDPVIESIVREYIEIGRLSGMGMGAI